MKVATQLLWIYAKKTQYPISASMFFLFFFLLQDHSGNEAWSIGSVFKEIIFIRQFDHGFFLRVRKWRWKRKILNLITQFCCCFCNFFNDFVIGILGFFEFFLILGLDLKITLSYLTFYYASQFFSMTLFSKSTSFSL